MKVYDKILIKRIEVSVYKIPTNTPESDGTIEWDSTTMVLVNVYAGNERGLGYTYAPRAAASVVYDTLTKEVVGRNALDIPAANAAMIRAIRNSGNCGIAMMAVSAVDNALWDLKARLFDIPLCELIGTSQDAMLVYGSGGFTSYDEKQLTSQLSGWRKEGIKYMKIKVGTHFRDDPKRIAQARKAIGPDNGLFIDANGAYTIRQALYLEEICKDEGIEWFEEPVTSDNLAGLRFIRDHSLDRINVAAGEYGYNLPYFKTMLAAGAVDVLQADATRCGGITNFLKAGHIAESWQIPFSSHCAPSLHLHATLSLPGFYIAEYFFDHARIEKIFFDGFREPKNSHMHPDLGRPGNGLALKEKDAKKFMI